MNLAFVPSVTPSALLPDPAFWRTRIDALRRIRRSSTIETSSSIRPFTRPRRSPLHSTNHSGVDVPDLYLRYFLTLVHCPFGLGLPSSSPFCRIGEDLRPLPVAASSRKVPDLTFRCSLPVRACTLPDQSTPPSFSPGGLPDLWPVCLSLPASALMLIRCG